MYGKAPVLIIGFNRPNSTQQVFDAVRIAQPDKLYYAVDGPRLSNDSDEEKVHFVREIVKQVDWPCEVHTLFRKENVGCGFGPADAISWAFEDEDSLIVLEDDCIPSQSFFRFCNQMLWRYKDDKRVNIISGRSQHAGSHFFYEQDYVFTHYAHTWGWATWKRVWKEFDIYMKDVPSWLAQGGALNVLPTKKMAIRSNRHIKKIYNNIEKEVLHSWDSQWSYARLKTGGLGIVPCQNLIHNIGEFGTHSFGHTKHNELFAGEMPSVIRHPRFVIVNREYEIYHYKHYITSTPTLLSRVIGKISREGLVPAIKNYLNR